MYKKNLWLFALAGLMSITLLSGVILYSFRLQEREDRLLQDFLAPTPTEAVSAGKEADITPDQTGLISNKAENQTTEQASGVTDANGFVPASPENKAPDNSTTAASAVQTDYSSGEPSLTPTVSPAVMEDIPTIVLAFAGDINLDEDSKPVARYDEHGKGILGCISPELVEEMNAADIMMLNNEFAYSLRGTEAQDKSYTFRADPKRVNILKEMGVDIVSLANNHALDFGMEALTDTFSTLEDADVVYVGAGDDLARAKAPAYYTIGTKRIAFLAASRVVFAMDWYASDQNAGMIGTYDPTLLLEGIREAEKNSDFVVVYVHWGVERTNYPTDYQKSLARQYIDAGADAVIGCHPHVLQGLEFYQGKPIAYSLGNYWFNNTTREAGLLKLYIQPDGALKVQLLPTLGESTYTSLIKDKPGRDAYFNFMKEISFGIEIDEDGYVTEAADAVNP